MTEHQERYEAIAQTIGVDKLRAILENGTLTVGRYPKSKTYKAFPEPAEMARLAAEDQHLNNVSLMKWDAQHENVRALLKGTGIKSWSLSDTVCTLKHVAKFHYSETLAETEAKKPKPEHTESVQTCKRCGSPLKLAFCSDLTCPFSDYRQNDPKGWEGHPNPPDETPEPEEISLEQFISKHGIKFECHRVDSRPDGLMDADFEKDGLAVTRTKDRMRHFRCKITKTHEDITGVHPKGVGSTTRSFGLYFSQGSAHTEDPTLADVLDCLASDAAGYEGRDFAEWAGDYGYDTDSRKAEKTFKAIKRQAEQLKRTIGSEAYEELLYKTERL